MSGKFYFAFYVFMSVKNSHILAVIYFLFPKERPGPDSKVLENQTKFGPLKKDQKLSYHVRQLSALFGNLVALILG